MAGNEPLNDTGGDHIEFHRNRIDKAVGVEQHIYLPHRRSKTGLLVAAGTALAVSLSVAVYFSSSTSRETNPRAATVSAMPTSSPPGLPPGRGFPLRIDQMAFRILSRQWTQTATGDIELWFNNHCPQGTSHYWVALRPNGEVVQFSCNSWQYHKWSASPAGVYYFEIWKEHDGQVIHGSGVLRSSVPIVMHPKWSPTPVIPASRVRESPQPSTTT